MSIPDHFLPFYLSNFVCSRNADWWFLANKNWLGTEKILRGWPFGNDTFHPKGRNQASILISIIYITSKSAKLVQ